MIKKNLPPSKRPLKMSETLKRVISEIINQKKALFHIIGEMHITVSEVKLSPDFRIAKIFIMPNFDLTNNYNQAPETDQKPSDQRVEIDNIISLINQNSHKLNKYLSDNTSLKFLPKLQFIYDDLFERVEKMDNLFDSIKD